MKLALKPLEFFEKHSRIVGAMMMRETTTRYGREGIGFLWVVGEPLLFCGFVLIMWTLIKPEYEHGIRLGPFVMTGYMSLLMLRHMVGLAMYALQANTGLLYHRQINMLHIYISRNFLEFCGSTAAFIIVYLVLGLLGQVGMPADILKLYAGWVLLAFMGGGTATIMAALSMRSDLMERLVPVMTYALIPLSGAFFMVGWLPQQFRDLFLLIPFPNAVEMLRAGVFGEFVPTYYHTGYAIASAAVLNLFGLLLLASSRDLIDVE